MKISDIAYQINQQSRNYNVGGLQSFRGRLHARNSRTHKIFSAATIFTEDEYAFHDGGRTELQYNIGFENRRDGKFLRHGVAFSFETSRSLPSLEPLVPKVLRFNDYIREHKADFSDFYMWHWSSGAPSIDRHVVEIDSILVETGCFVFMGRRVPESRIDISEILSEFDRLYPLYVYVESGAHVPEPSEGYEFKHGCTVKPLRTTATHVEKQLDINLRHNALHIAVFEALESEYPNQRIATEYKVAQGAKVDVAVELPTGYWFYEIKVAPTTRAAVREAVGQLLEYSHWPNDYRADKLIIVGETQPTKSEMSYMKRLRDQYQLPIFFRRFDIARKRFDPEI